MSDVLAVIQWWIIIQALGLAVWPLAFRLCRWLPDRGYMLSKPLGLLLVSYLFWLLVSFHMLPNTIFGLSLSLILVAVISTLLYRRERHASLFTWLREHRGLVIAHEAFFVIVFIGWSLLRAHMPDAITGEKPMELAFLNAINRSAMFPPNDPWLSGYPIAYYYFGYVMMSVLQRLSNVNAGVAFSMSNALWFALSAAGAFGIVANLVLLTRRSARRAAIFCGILGAVLLTLTSNFETPLEIAYVNGQGSDAFWQQLDILDLNQPRTSSLSWPLRETWWWRASRVIHDYPPDSISPRLAAILNVPPAPNTTAQEVINEFPQFSFLLGDMHPHVLDLPFVLLCLALALNLFWATATGEVTAIWGAPLWIMYPVLLGALGFINTWDFPIYAFVTLMAVVLGCWQHGRPRWRNRLVEAFLLGGLGIAFYLPFYLNFTSQASGLGPNPFNGTRLSHFFIVFGPLIIVNLMFGLKLIFDAQRAGQIRWFSFGLKSIGGGVMLTALAGAATAGLFLIVLARAPTRLDIQAGLTDPMASNISLSLSALYHDWIASLSEQGVTLNAQLLARLSDPWVPILLGSGLGAIVLLWHAQRSHRGEPSSAETLLQPFVLLLLGVGLLLAFGVEFVFISDLFKTRMNTLFKFYFQVWLLWSVAGAYGLYVLLAGPQRIRLKVWRTVVGGIAVGALGVGLLFPALAIPSRIQEVKVVTPMLDGLAAAAQSPLYPNLPQTNAAINWFNQHVSGSSVILEASDDEFLYSLSRSRFSAWTGLPTLLGWYWHETQWRGNDVVQRQRLMDISTIYSTTDEGIARSLVQKYNVEYIVLSGRERKQYPHEGLIKFARMYPVVFHQGNLIIYQTTTDFTRSIP